MAGNVWEMTAGKPDIRQPTRLSLRAGSYIDPVESMAVTNRFMEPETYAHPAYGFRLCGDLE